MKKFAMFILTGAFCAVCAFAQNTDAAAIMQRTKEWNAGSGTMSSRSRMVITAKDGGTSERVLDQYSKEDANGRSRSMVVFQSPATVKGTRFLTLENAAGKNDQWIFLPGAGKVRRIASSESGSNFMGTDFSYDDMSALDRGVDLDTHTVLREETLSVNGVDAGAACYVIQSTPKVPADFQYSKAVYWVDKSKYRVYKTEFYSKRGAVEKVMEVSGYKDVQGRDTPTQIKLSTVAAGTSTTLYMDIIKYDDPVPEGVFTTAYLETGRVR